MRRQDKLKVIMEANQRLEEKHLGSKGLIIKEDITTTVKSGEGWDAKEKTVVQGNLTLNSYAKKLYTLFKKEGAKVKLSSTGFKSAGDMEGNQVGIDTASTQGDGIKISINVGENSMQMANKYGPMILKTLPDLEVTEKPKEITGWEGVNAVEFILKPKKGANLT
jgi:hypothetical protein